MALGDRRLYRSHRVLARATDDLAPADGDRTPGGARRRRTGERRGGLRSPDDAAESAAAAVSPARRDRAHRPRPYRPRMAVALRRDAPQTAPDLPHRPVADAALGRLPLQSVDGAL